SPADVTRVREIGAEQPPQITREKAPIEVAKERPPPVPRRPERPPKGGPAAGQRALVAGDRARIADESPAGAAQAQREIHVLVVGEEGRVERVAVRSRGLERLATIERRRRR